VFQENSAIDLSSTGISFSASREYSKGSLVLLEVEMLKEPVKLLVCVAWTKKEGEGRFQVGAELVAIDPEQRKQLQAHLAKMIKSSAPKKSAKKPKKKKVAKKKSSRRVSKNKKSRR
jgi:Tfp pilus assembly protein PilZ